MRLITKIKNWLFGEEKWGVVFGEGLIPTPIRTRFPDSGIPLYEQQFVMGPYDTRQQALNVANQLRKRGGLPLIQDWGEE